MPSLRAQRLSFAYSAAVPLLAGVDFHLAPGFTGLVGENGAGKTTLLRLLAGELRPEEGHIRLEPTGARVITCAQTVESLESAVLALAEDASAMACRIKGQLDLEPATLERWATLSPGERKRWQVGAALAAEPSVLLLDEPTNHLDEGARARLVAALRRFPGIGVVVSHDRALLEELTTSTLRLHRGGARLYPGAYAEARRAWEAEARAEITEHKRRKDEQHRAVSRLHEARRDHEGALASTRSRRQMKDKNDHDGRGALTKGRAESAEKGLGRQVGVVRRKLERVIEEVESLSLDKELGRSVFVGYARAPSPLLITIDEREIRAGDRVVLRDVRLDVGREDRIRIEGPNGAGKTTLLRALLARARVPANKVLYVPQDLTSAEARALLAEARALPKDERGRVLSIVAALGVDPDRLLGSASPSPGEARKLMIAMGLGRHAFALALDEPTNHLDLPSIERLEEALVAYPGALLLVTHDAGFARRATSSAIRIEGGRITASTRDARHATGASRY